MRAQGKYISSAHDQTFLSHTNLVSMTKFMISGGESRASAHSPQEKVKEYAKSYKSLNILQGLPKKKCLHKFKCLQLCSPGKVTCWWHT